MNVIETDRLTKYYGNSRGIEDLTLSVKQGEFFGFIGPNGAGKSTTIRTLLGLISPTAGSAKVFGKDIIKEKTVILGDIGYLPSEAVFYSGMKVKDVISFSARLRKKDCSKRAAELCERLKLDVEKKVEDLSFGNRKKVGIVCALQSDASLLILDEPTGGLDPLMQHEFFEIIKERNRNGATVFLSSHVLSEVERYCSRAAVIKEGRLIASGSMEELSQSNARRVSVKGTVDLKGLDGVKDLRLSDGGAEFLFGGDINDLLSRLCLCRITDLTVSEPDLEEVFMHYYQRGDAK